MPDEEEFTTPGEDSEDEGEHSADTDSPGELENTEPGDGEPGEDEAAGSDEEAESEEVDLTDGMTQLAELGYDNLEDAVKALKEGEVLKKRYADAEKKITEQGQSNSGLAEQFGEMQEKINSLLKGQKPEEAEEEDGDEEFESLLENPRAYMDKRLKPVFEEMKAMAAKINTYEKTEALAEVSNKAVDTAMDSLEEKYSERLTPEVREALNKVLDTPQYSSAFEAIGVDNFSDYTPEQISEFYFSIFERALGKVVLDGIGEEIEKAVARTEARVQKRYIQRKPMDGPPDARKVNLKRSGSGYDPEKEMSDILSADIRNR